MLLISSWRSIHVPSSATSAPHQRHGRPPVPTSVPRFPSAIPAPSEKPPPLVAVTTPVNRGRARPSITARQRRTGRIKWFLGRRMVSTLRRRRRPLPAVRRTVPFPLRREHTITTPSNPRMKKSAIKIGRRIRRQPCSDEAEDRRKGQGSDILTNPSSWSIKTM